MSYNTKIFLGILTVIPLILAGIILTTVFGILIGILGEIPAGYATDTAFMISNMFVIIGMAVAAGTLNLALLIYYIIHVVNNKHLDNNTQIIWILILLFFSAVGSIVYWYMNIWREGQ